MTIWKSNNELPEFDREFMVIYDDGSKNIDEFLSEKKAREHYLENQFNCMPNFIVYRQLDDDVVKWCYLDDLLAQQAEIDRLREALKFYAKEDNYSYEYGYNC